VCLNYTTLAEALYKTNSIYNSNTGVYLYYALKTASYVFDSNPMAGKNKLALFASGN